MKNPRFKIEDFRSYQKQAIPNRLIINSQKNFIPIYGKKGLDCLNGRLARKWAAKGPPSPEESSKMVRSGFSQTKNGKSLRWLAPTGSLMEATPRFELGNKGFADLCLTTWLCRRLERKTRLELATLTLAR